MNDNHAGLDAATLFPVTDRDLENLRGRLARRAETQGLVDVAYRTLDTPVGRLLLAATTKGLVRVAYEREGFPAVLETLAARVSPRVLQAPRRLDPAARELEEYFTGSRDAFDLPLDYALSRGFRQTVQRHLSHIGYGHTQTYRTVAEHVGNPKAVRAVGTACATNPLPIVVPCHRVLRSDGSLGGYIGGFEAKTALLHHEAASLGTTGARQLRRRTPQHIRDQIRRVAEAAPNLSDPSLNLAPPSRRPVSSHPEEGQQMQELDHHGGLRPRGITEVPRSSISSGRFGRLFRNLEPLHLADEQLQALAAQMTESAAGTVGGWSGAPTPQDNPAIPAGYTYLAQFLDHDITFDPSSSLERQNDPNALENYRTPRYDLDSVYGGGPQASPYLYDDADPDLLLIGANPTGSGFEPTDLPRNQQGRALIGDPRNDVHLIVSQLHLVFLRFHNAAVNRVRTDPALKIGAETDFQTAQRLVRWHYQWIIVFDLLPKLVGTETADAVLNRDSKGRLQAQLALYKPRNQAFMPVEHSAAAYRLGHSMIRPSYQLKPGVGPIPIFSPSPTAQPTEDLRGFRPLPASWTIAWDHFFPGLGPDPATVQPSRLIDSHIADPLATLPPKVDAQQRSLALLNLFRGDRLGLPAGDAVAAAVAARVPGITAAPLTASDLGLSHPAPLWFYILKEAEAHAVGQHLGQTGGRIVAEVLVGLLAKDPASFLRAAPSWIPSFTAAQPGSYAISDLIQAAARATA